MARNTQPCFSDWRCAIGFFGSLFGGSNPTLSKDINQFGALGGYASGLGEKNLSQASNFMSSILSGDQSKIAKVLGPQIGSIQQQTQQSRNVASQFGPRGGGSTAAMQMAGDTSRSNINSMISSLLGSSASGLGSLGSSLLGQGMQAYGQQAQLSQEQMENQSGGLLGLGLTKAVGGGVGAGLNYLSGGAS